jgi:type I restriction enzyme S subunit
MLFVKLSECCEFIKDGTHGSPIRVDKGIPVLSATNVKNGSLDFNTERFTTNEELKEFRKRLFPKKDDVLLTIVGTIGRTAIISDETPRVFQRSVCVLRPNKNYLNSQYLRYVLESSGVKAQLERETREVAQAGVYLESLNEIEIPLPPLAEQKRIAAIAQKADRLRRTRRYALQLSDTYLQSVFLEMFGDSFSNTKGWQYKEFGDIITTLTDYHANGSYEILRNNVGLLDKPDYALMIRTTDLKRGDFLKDVKYIAKSAYEFLEKSKLFGGGNNYQ